MFQTSENVAKLEQLRGKRGLETEGQTTPLPALSALNKASHGCCPQQIDTGSVIPLRTHKRSHKTPSTLSAEVISH